jgi:hypothetical protein
MTGETETARIFGNLAGGAGVELGLPPSASNPLPPGPNDQNRALDGVLFSQGGIQESPGSGRGSIALSAEEGLDDRLKDPRSIRRRGSSDGGQMDRRREVPGVSRRRGDAGGSGGEAGRGGSGRVAEDSDPEDCKILRDLFDGTGKHLYAVPFVLYITAANQTPKRRLS